jgi:hypothetical protein
MRGRSRRWAICAITLAFCALGLSFSLQTLIPHWDGDRLQIAAPGLHFLTGKALDRLHDGASIPFAFQMTLTTIPRSIPLQRALDRFVISYDVWGERFKVAQYGGRRKSVTNLTANAAEAWCIEQMGMPSGGLPADKDLWLRLEIRSEEPLLNSPITSSGLNLASLIDALSGKPGPGVQEWVAETAPFRLASIRR